MEWSKGGWVTNRFGSTELVIVYSREFRSVVWESYMRRLTWKGRPKRREEADGSSQRFFETFRKVRDFSDPTVRLDKELLKCKAQIELQRKETNQGHPNFQVQIQALFPFQSYSSLFPVHSSEPSMVPSIVPKRSHRWTLATCSTRWYLLCPFQLRVVRQSNREHR